MSYLYVISNPAWPGWYKIGRAKRLEDRLKQYYTACPHRDFKIDFSIKVANVKPYERYFYDAEGSKNEWVYMDLQDIISCINQIKDGEIIEEDKQINAEIQSLKKENQKLRDQYNALIKVSVLNNTK